MTRTDSPIDADRKLADELERVCERAGREWSYFNLISRAVAALRAPRRDEPVAWRYKCQDGSYVLLETRLTDAQKARGYYTGDEGEDEVEGNEAVIGPFYWSEETPFYAHPQPAGAEREENDDEVSVDVLPVFWRGRAQAFRQIDSVRAKSDRASLREAAIYETCADELSTALTASHTPVRSSGLEEVLKQAEATFENIRTILINNLNEPERRAFWRAVKGRDAIRAALNGGDHE
jgi:hypothetical protein